MVKMDQQALAIRPSYADPECNTFLGSLDGSRGAPYSVRYTQGEESYVLLEREIEIPSFPIHHDVRSPAPSAEYLKAVRPSVRKLAQALPQAFAGLSYFFDSAEIAKPCFFKVYQANGRLFLYLLRIDLGFRPQYSRMTARGDNDRASAYASRRVFFESDLIPLEGVEQADGKASAFKVLQAVPQTWAGETGKGYMARGIWMDADISKFFSKLFLPMGKNSYPFLPLSCKYKSVCATILKLSPDGRREAVPLLLRALDFLTPRIEAIFSSLKGKAFAESLPEFLAFKKQVPEAWGEAWAGLKVKPYLNEEDQKEYLIEP
jgi:hypothetical protein